MNPAIFEILTVKLQINDPCDQAIINSDSRLVINDLIVSDDDKITKIVYNGPIDSVSSLYGNGYDKCGDFQY